MRGVPGTARKAHKASVADNATAPHTLELIARFQFVGLPTILGAVRAGIAGKCHGGSDSATVAMGCDQEIRHYGSPETRQTGF